MILKLLIGEASSNLERVLMGQSSPLSRDSTGDKGQRGCLIN